MHLLPAVWYALIPSHILYSQSAIGNSLHVFSDILKKPFCLKDSWGCSSMDASLSQWRAWGEKESIWHPAWAQMASFKAERATQPANQITLLSWKSPGDSNMLVKKKKKKCMNKTVKMCVLHSTVKLALTGQGIFFSCVITSFYYAFELHQSSWSIMDKANGFHSWRA